MCCLHALLRVRYTGLLFLSFFFALPKILPSLVPFQLSPTSPSLTKHCKHHKSHWNFLVSNTTVEGSTHTNYNLPSSHSPLQLIVPCLPPKHACLGHAGLFPSEELFVLSTLSFISLGNTNIKIFPVNWMFAEWASWRCLCVPVNPTEPNQ